MRKFIAYFLNNLRLYLKMLPMQLGVFVVMPIAFILFMGWSMSGVSDVQSSEIDIDVAIDNQDQGDYGRLLTETLSSEAMSQLIHVKKDAAIEIQIPKDFSKNIHQSSLGIKVHGEPRMTHVEMVKGFLQSWHQTLVDQATLQAATRNLSDQDRNQLLSQLQSLEIINPSKHIQKVATQKERRLTLIETYLISGLIYCLIMGLSSTTAMVTQDQFSGLLKRINIAPLTMWQRTIFAWLADFVLLFWHMCLVLGLMSFHPQVHIDNLWRFIPWLFLLAGLFQAIGMCVSVSLPKMGIQIVVQMLVLFFIFTGFFPVGDLLEGKLKALVETNVFQSYISHPLQEILLGHDINQGWMILLAYLGLTLVALGLTYVLGRRKEQRA